jgi:hypothetical protein
MNIIFVSSNLFFSNLYKKSLFASTGSLEALSCLINGYIVPHK